MQPQSTASLQNSQDAEDKECRHCNHESVYKQAFEVVQPLVSAFSNWDGYRKTCKPDNNADQAGSRPSAPESGPKPQQTGL